VQYLSGACRASRTEMIQSLPAARILRCVDDADVERCRTPENRGSRANWLAMLLLTVPTTIFVLGKQNVELSRLMDCMMVKQ
jgi:hypothetical protein